MMRKKSPDHKIVKYYQQKPSSMVLKGRLDLSFLGVVLPFLILIQLKRLNVSTCLFYGIS